MVLPDPIPNSAVKHCVADGSACKACARVGSRQIKKPQPRLGFFFVPWRLLIAALRSSNNLERVTLEVFRFGDGGQNGMIEWLLVGAEQAKLSACVECGLANNIEEEFALHMMRARECAQNSAWPE